MDGRPDVLHLLQQHAQGHDLKTLAFHLMDAAQGLVEAAPKGCDAVIDWVSGICGATYSGGLHAWQRGELPAACMHAKEVQLRIALGSGLHDRAAR